VPKASFSVIFATGVDTDLQSVPFPFRRQINQRIYKLKDAPRPIEAEVIEGQVMLLKIERWGLVYEVDDLSLSLTVWAVVQL
jgi:hypothetical protein